jgi:hypothetical protein
VAIAYVRDSGIQAAAGVSTPSVALASVAAGNLLAVGIGHWNGGGAGVASIADDKSNVYAAPQQQTHFSGNGDASIWYAKNVAAGTTTITLTPTVTGANNYWTWGVAEFSGLDTTSPLDVSAKNTAVGTSTDANVTSGATTQADELVLAVASVGLSGDSDISWGSAASSGYTNLMKYANWASIETISFDYKIVSATGAQSASWSHDNVSSSPNSWAAVIATFKAAGAAAVIYTRLERGVRGLMRGVA